MVPLPPLVMSLFRCSRDSSLQALEMIKTIAQYVSDRSILETIVPFLVSKLLFYFLPFSSSLLSSLSYLFIYLSLSLQHFLIKDDWSSVRAEAIRTLSFCLSIIRRVPRRCLHYTHASNMNLSLYIIATSTCFLNTFSQLL